MLPTRLHHEVFRATFWHLGQRIWRTTAKVYLHSDPGFTVPDWPKSSWLRSQASRFQQAKPLKENIDWAWKCIAKGWPSDSTRSCEWQWEQEVWISILRLWGYEEQLPKFQHNRHVQSGQYEQTDVPRENTQSRLSKCKHNYRLLWGSVPPNQSWKYDECLMAGENKHLAADWIDENQTLAGLRLRE